jgi:hypothetical protein
MVAAMTGSQELTAPQGVLPGQLGIIMLGRVIMGDVAVTMVDLALRQAVRVEEDPASGWLVSGLDSPSSAMLTDYEKALVHALPNAPSPLDRVEAPGLEKVRSALIHDGVSRGWLRHLDHEHRTSRAEDLAKHVRAFQRALREQRQEDGEAALTGPLLPYALHFGLLSEDAAPLARFAHAWVKAFGELPGWRPPKPPKPTYDDQKSLPGEHWGIVLCRSPGTETGHPGS